MEVPNGSNNKLSVMAYEFLGTAFLLYAINMSGGNPFAIGFTVFCLLITGGKISGAHYNPSVSIGVYIQEWNFGALFPLFALIFIAQCSGAFFGVWLALLSQQNGDVVHADGSVDPLLLPKLCPKDGFGVCDPDSNGSQAFLIETICTFLFVIVNLVVKYDPASPTIDGFLKCLGVAIALASMIRLSGAYTGACLNTAVAFAQTAYVISQVGNEDDQYSKFLWVYALGPILGSILAGLAFKLHIKACERAIALSKEDQSSIMSKGGRVNKSSQLLQD